MTGEKKAEKSTEALEMVPKTDSLEEQNAVCGREIEPSHSMSSLSSPGIATVSSKEGYDGTCPEQEDQGYFLSQEGLELLHSGVQVENNSLVYCMPSYITYAPGQVMAIEGQSLGQQPYLSSAHPFLWIRSDACLFIGFKTECWRSSNWTQNS